MALEWTIFPSLYNADAFQSHSGSWFQLSSLLTTFETFAKKEHAPLWSPFPLSPGQRRENPCVRELHCSVFDFDGQEPPWDKFTGLTFVAHTTHSHTPSKPKWRVAFPLDRPCPADKWKQVWLSLAARFPGADGQCKDACRGYFLPSSPDGAERMIRRGSGQSLVWASLEPAPPAERQAAAVAHLPATSPLERKDLDKLQKSWERSADEKRKALALPLKNLLRGHPYSEEGGRNVILFEVLCALKEKLALVSAEKLLEFFRESLEATEGGPTEAEFVSQWGRARSENTKRVIAQAESGEMATFYTEAQIERISQITGLDLDDLRTNQYWFAYTSVNNVYRLELDGYRPYVLDHSTIVGMKNGRYRANIGLTNFDGKPLKPAELLGNHGIQCKRILYTYGPSKFEWSDIEHPELLINCVRVRDDIKADFSPRVDQWLQSFAGDNYEYLVQWIANLQDLTVPDNLIALMGPKNTGKSLFLAALGCLFRNEGAIDIENATYRFNDELRSCPIVVKDEANELHDRMSMESLKRLVTTRYVRVEAKGKEATQIIGSPRLLIASNNMDWCDNYAAMINDGGLGAAASRLFPVYIGPGAAACVPSSNEFATVLGHFKFLVQNVPFKQWGRFTLPDLETDKVEQILSPIVRKGPELDVFAAIRKLINRPPFGDIEIWISGDGVVFRTRAIRAQFQGSVSHRTVDRWLKRVKSDERGYGLRYLSFKNWAQYEYDETAEQLQAWAKTKLTTREDTNDSENSTLGQTGQS